MTLEQAQRWVDSRLAKMAAVREKRVRPARDEKIITAWNALMISALAHGYQVLGDEKYLRAATKAAHFLLSQRDEAGHLPRTYAKGQVKRPAYLEDYAYMANALTDLYESTFAPAWLGAAQQLAEVMRREFLDREGGAFFFTPSEHEQLPVRPKEAYDGSTPSGNSMAALALLRLARLLDRPEWWQEAESTLSLYAPQMAKMPRGYMQMLCAADFYLGPVKEIVVVGDGRSQHFGALLSTLHRAFLPHVVLAGFDGAVPTDLPAEQQALFAGKTPVNGKPAAYVCQNFACNAPVTDLESLKAQLGL